jgi:hypothetical protein
MVCRVSHLSHYILLHCQNGDKKMRVAGLFVVMTIAIGIVEGLDTPGGVSLWHILLVAIAAFAVERLYSGFVMKERCGI